MLFQQRAQFLRAEAVREWNTRLCSYLLEADGTRCGLLRQRGYAKERENNVSRQRGTVSFDASG